MTKGGPCFAASPVQSGQDDQRAAARSVALFRPGLIESGSYRFFCLVRNISASGLMANVHAPLEIGAPITVRLSERQLLIGSVVWQKGMNTGVEFANTIDVEKILSGAWRSGNAGESYRPPRLEVLVDAQFIVSGQPYALRVLDISQRGLKAAARGLATGTMGTMVVPELRPCSAVVRWSGETMAGFYFLDPLSFDELGQWVLLQHGHDRRQTDDY